MSDFDPRRAKPGDTFTVTEAGGEVSEFKADDDGVVRPTTARQKGLLDSLRLPVARTAQAEDRAAAAEAGAEAEAEADKPVRAVGPDAAKGGKG